MSHGAVIDGDTPGMPTSRILLAILAAAVAAGCSSAPEAAPAPRPTSSTTSPPTTTTSAPVANEVTTKACREYAEAPALVDIRRTIQSGAGAAATGDVADAFTVVFDLEVTAVQPGLDPEVAAAMEQASQMSEAMRKAWVDSGSLDPVAFERMAVYVDDACERAGVDMAPPA